MSESPITRAEIVSLVRSNLAEILEISPESVSEDATFASLDADSLALIELVEALEEALSLRVAGFRIDDEDLESLSSVADAVNYVANKLSAA